MCVWLSQRQTLFRSSGTDPGNHKNTHPVCTGGWGGSSPNGSEGCARSSSWVLCCFGDVTSSPGSTRTECCCCWYRSPEGDVLLLLGRPRRSEPAGRRLVCLPLVLKGDSCGAALDFPEILVPSGDKMRRPDSCLGLQTWSFLSRVCRMDEVCTTDASAHQQPQHPAAAGAHQQARSQPQAVQTGGGELQHPRRHPNPPGSTETRPLGFHLACFTLDFLSFRIMDSEQPHAFPAS